MAWLRQLTHHASSVLRHLFLRLRGLDPLHHGQFLGHRYRRGRSCHRSSFPLHGNPGLLLPVSKRTVLVPGLRGRLITPPPPPRLCTVLTRTSSAKLGSQVTLRNSSASGLGPRRRSCTTSRTRPKRSTSADISRTSLKAPRRASWPTVREVSGSPRPVGHVLRLTLHVSSSGDEHSPTETGPLAASYGGYEDQPLSPTQLYQYAQQPSALPFMADSSPSHEYPPRQRGVPPSWPSEHELNQTPRAAHFAELSETPTWRTAAEDLYSNEPGWDEADDGNRHTRDDSRRSYGPGAGYAI